MLMTFYVLFLMICSLLVAVTSNNSRLRTNTILGFLIYLPIYGRSLGWW